VFYPVPACFNCLFPVDDKKTNETQKEINHQYDIGLIILINYPIQTCVYLLTIIIIPTQSFPEHSKNRSFSTAIYISQEFRAN
jgi:hypothetical protein